MKKLICELTAVPHLFSKIIVLWCILFGTAASAYALHILNNTGRDPAALLGIILAFFGGELMFLCLRKILNEKPKTNNKRDDTEETV